MAGYRGQGPIITFVAVRLIAPFAIFAVTAFYVFIVLNLPYSFFVKLAIVMAAACLGYYAPTFYVRNRIAKRQSSIRQAWPDALDLTLICVESGMGIEGAFQRVADEIGDRSVSLRRSLASRSPSFPICRIVIKLTRIWPSVLVSTASRRSLSA